MNGLLLAVTIENIASRKDKTVKIVLGTQELSPERAGEIFGLQNKLSAIYISPKEKIPQSEIDLVDSANADFESKKSQSQRLRNVLYRLFEKSPEGFKDFDTFYHAKTEQVIEHFKSKID